MGLGFRAKDGLAEVPGELLIGGDRVATPEDRDLAGIKAQIHRRRVDEESPEAVADDADGRVGYLAWSGPCVSHGANLLGTGIGRFTRFEPTWNKAKARVIPGPS